MNNSSWLNQYNQINLFTDEPKISSIGLTSSNVRVIVGQFFELLASNLFIGVDTNNHKNKDRQPDITIWKSKKQKFDFLIECKATNKSHIFDDRQINYYQDIEKGDVFPYTNSKIYYCLFFYNNDRPLMLESSAWNLLKFTLPKSIKCCVILPLSIIKMMCNSGKKYTYGKWYSDNGREFYYRIKESSAQIMSLGTKQAAIDSIFLQTKTDISKNYKISKYQSPNIKILNVAIDSFPIITISKDNINKILKKE